MNDKVLFAGKKCDKIMKKKTIWYRKYGSWETDAIIANEMFIGVGTAAGCIFCVTVIMINSFVTAVIVMLCCLLTLTFVGG